MCSIPKLNKQAYEEAVENLIDLKDDLDKAKADYYKKLQIYQTKSAIVKAMDEKINYLYGPKEERIFVNSE